MEAGSTLRQVMGSACRYRCLAAEPHFAVGADFYIRPPLRLSPDSRPAAAGRGADQVGKHPHPSAARSTRQQKPSTVRERARPAGPPGQRVAKRNARKEEQRQVRFFTPSLRRSRYAGTRLFARQGKAQGRRGHRRPPDRFARPPYSDKTPQPGHFAAPAVFFCQDKRKWGRILCGYPAASRRAMAALTIRHRPRPPHPPQRARRPPSSKGRKALL